MAPLQIPYSPLRIPAAARGSSIETSSPVSLMYSLKAFPIARASTGDSGPVTLRQRTATPAPSSQSTEYRYRSAPRPVFSSMAAYLNLRSPSASCEATDSRHLPILSLSFPSAYSATASR